MKIEVLQPELGDTEEGYSHPNTDEGSSLIPPQYTGGSDPVFSGASKEEQMTLRTRTSGLDGTFWRSMRFRWYLFGSNPRGQSDVGITGSVGSRLPSIHSLTRNSSPNRLKNRFPGLTYRNTRCIRDSVNGCTYWHKAIANKRFSSVSGRPILNEMY